MTAWATEPHRSRFQLQAKLVYLGIIAFAVGVAFSVVGSRTADSESLVSLSLPEGGPIVVSDSLVISGDWQGLEIDLGDESELQVGPTDEGLVVTVGKRAARRSG